jgi:hypothetical protein
VKPPRAQYAWNGDVAIAYGVVGDGPIDLVYVQGYVSVSRTVKDLTAGSGIAFEDAGEHELKGVPDRWRLYRVVA